MAEAQERQWMSARERDRLKVLHEVRKRHIIQKQAGVELGISARWVRTLVKRLLALTTAGRPWIRPSRHGLWQAQSVCR